MAGNDNAPVSGKKLSLAVFASDKGRGNAERTSIMSEAGSFLAKKGVRILYPVGVDGISVPLVKSARAAGGEVVFLGLNDLPPPPGLADVVIEQFETAEALHTELQGMADAYLGLPGSLSSVTALFELWLATGGQKPVALLNRNKAYELMRGFAVDILAHGKPDWERSLQVSDNLDDLWSRLNKMVAASR